MDQATREKHYQNVQQLFKDLGEDPARDGLRKTPERMVKSLEDLTSGYTESVAEAIGDAMFDVTYQDMVIVRDIELYSLCEHHVLPFHGRCHVGYIPRGKVVGLSKIPRIVDIFARRLQVQERLTAEVARAIEEHLQPEGVGVVVEAYHLCMMMRGVSKQNSYTMTSAMHGSFERQETRNEFLSLIRAPKP